MIPATNNRALPVAASGGITERRQHSGFTMEMQTDCHGDYTRCIIQLLKGRIEDVLPLFTPFGRITTYLPGLYRLDKAHFFKILFSEPENTICITLRKKAKATVLTTFAEILEGTRKTKEEYRCIPP